ncbi:MAG: hypothetical protein KIH67_003980, partial [Candidatus Moranbacteria bacterium]|nr:hypothetical protein [Candidatus Moranbacteria bacterium]
FFDQEFPLERQGELRSVDLRTENRIYYALKNSNPEDASEEVKTDEEKAVNSEGATDKPSEEKKKEKKTKEN